MAVITVALRLESSAAGTMAKSARRHLLFSCLMNAGLVMERRLAIFFEKRSVAGLAIFFGSHDVRRVIERHISVLRFEDELCGRRFGLLSEQAKPA